MKERDKHMSEIYPWFIVLYQQIRKALRKVFINHQKDEERDEPANRKGKERIDDTVT